MGPCAQLYISVIYFTKTTQNETIYFRHSKINRLKNHQLNSQ